MKAFEVTYKDLFGEQFVEVIFAENELDVKEDVGKWSFTRKVEYVEEISLADVKLKDISVEDFLKLMGKFN